MLQVITAKVCKNSVIIITLTLVGTGCPQLNDPEHGQVTITPTSSSLVLPNSTAMYTCNTGYQLSETSGRRCQNNGTWTGNEPTCEGTDNYN